MTPECDRDAQSTVRTHSARQRMETYSCPTALVSEVHMPLLTLVRARANTDVISAILNWVCPDCGGRMGGRGKEFNCQGECQTDWRLIWKRVLSAGR